MTKPVDELESLRQDLNSNDKERKRKAYERLRVLSKKSKEEYDRAPKFINIQSGGTSIGTRIYDQDGHTIGNVLRCVITIDANKNSGMAVATLDVCFPSLDLENIKVNQIKYRK